ncbi:MAG: hypothetical protein NTZ19_07355 [Bacteroidetes bacterium]|nr:hypothetical protein [Bacteroidota bacterium]
MQTEKESSQIIVLKLFPGIISILTIIAGSIGLFKGQNKYYSLPFFIILIGAHLIYSVKYKLASKWLFFAYLSIALILILLGILY